MKTKSFKRVLALALATVVMLTACGQKETNTSESTKTSESTVTSESKVTSESTTASESEAEVKKEDLPIITMYPANANLFSGLRTGFQSDFFAEEGGFQLEIWAYSDEKTTAMLTSGDLPDLMYIGAGDVETLETLIETDKIINYDDYKDQLPHFFGEECVNQYFEANYEIIREKWSAGTGGLYVLPNNLGTSPYYYSNAGTFDRNPVKIKWDVYSAIGCPEVTDFWQLIDVIEDMVAYQPTLEDGSKTTGTYLNSGSDNGSWGNMSLWYYWHSYDQNGHANLVEIDKVNGTVESIFEEDSVYKEGLLWYNELYRRGLLDPDSISTDRATQMAKVAIGQAMLPAGTAAGWEPIYYELFMPGISPYMNFESRTMSNVKQCIVINKETEHLDECLKLVDMLADPWADLNLVYGPEGDIWEIVDGNVIQATEAYKAWTKENGQPDGFPMSDGTNWSLVWNTPTANAKGIGVPGYVTTKGDPVAVYPQVWPEIQEITATGEIWQMWQKDMGATSLWDYTKQHGIEVCTESKFQGVPVPTKDDAQTLTLATIQDAVIAASWKMVYAESEADFEAIWDQMVKDAMDLGAQEYIDWFVENYEPNK